jgi:Cu/Ag efflux pump CusA
VAFSGWAVSRLGRDFLPPFDEGSVQVNVTLPPGSSLDASNQVAALIDAKLRAMQKTDDRPETARSSISSVARAGPRWMSMQRR